MQPNMEAVGTEFSNMLSQGTGTPETAEAQPATTEAPQQTQSPTQKQVAEYFEAMMDGKPIKLPYNLELPIKHNGQPMNVPLEKLANTYRQFEHIQSKHKDFQTKEQEFKARVGEWEQVQALKQKYGALQEWSEKNPEQFERLWNLYESRDQVLGQEQFNPLVPELQALKQELNDLKSFKNEWVQSRENERVEKNVKLIESQISEFKSDYPNLDLAEKDLDGVDLESRILQYGDENGHKDFLSAAFTFPGLRQRLIDSVRESVKAETAKQIKTDTKNGILARSAAPQAVKSDGPVNVKKMSERDRDAAALSEFERLIQS